MNLRPRRRIRPSCEAHVGSTTAPGHLLDKGRRDRQVAVFYSVMLAYVVMGAVRRSSAVAEHDKVAVALFNPLQPNTPEAVNATPAGDWDEELQPAAPKPSSISTHWCGSCQGPWGNCDKRLDFLADRYSTPADVGMSTIMKEGLCMDAAAGASRNNPKHTIHFRTYGNDIFVKSKKRIVQEAIDTGWFTSAKAYGPEDLPPSFRQKYGEILSLPRGGGYWIWRPYLIDREMSTIDEGDFLVFLDAGTHINKAGERRFRQYIQMVDESDHDMLCFQNGMPEWQWTTPRVFAALNVSSGDERVTHTGQHESGTLVMQKGPSFRRFIELCQRAIDGDPWIITDKYNNESKTLQPGFEENRHDQSIMSVARKLVGCIPLSMREYDWEQKNKPFHVLRLRE